MCAVGVWVRGRETRAGGNLLSQPKCINYGPQTCEDSRSVGASTPTGGEGPR